jgi:hypothetical protein
MGFKVTAQRLRVDLQSLEQVIDRIAGTREKAKKHMLGRDVSAATLARFENGRRQGTPNVFREVIAVHGLL